MGRYRDKLLLIGHLLEPVSAPLLHIAPLQLCVNVHYITATEWSRSVCVSECVPLVYASSFIKRGAVRRLVGLAERVLRNITCRDAIAN